MSRQMILFHLKSSTQSRSVPITGSSIKGREARELIAVALNLPEMEIILSFNDQEVTNDQSIEAFSELVVERRTGAKFGRPQSAYLKEKQKKASQVQEYIGLAKVDPVTGAPQGGAAGGNASGGGAMTEEQRIQALQENIGKETGDMNFMAQQRSNRFNRETRKPPRESYVCHNCMKKGHYIEDCPEPKNRERGKALVNPVGIAESKLELVDPTELEKLAAEGGGGSHMITRGGMIVKRKVEKGIFGGVDKPDHDWTVDASKIPPEFQCAVCHGLLRDAVMSGCCKDKEQPIVFCSECTDTLITQAEDSEEGCPLCPGCKEPLAIDEVEDATALRQKVAAFLKQSRKRPRDDL